jgi:uncharacterized repeat protein (TIGR03803 family)
VSPNQRWRRITLLSIIVALPMAGAARLSARQIEYQVLHSFDRGEDRPDAMISGADGTLYGVTHSGGANGEGTFFTMAPDGAITVLHSFNSVVDGVANPRNLIQASDGNFYGFSSRTVFRLTPDGTVGIVYTFSPVFTFQLPGQLAASPDGNLYGTSASPNSPYGGGTVFKLSPSSGHLTTLGSLPGDSDFFGKLTIATDGLDLSGVHECVLRLYRLQDSSSRRDGLAPYFHDSAGPHSRKPRRGGRQTDLRVLLKFRQTSEDEP